MKGFREFIGESHRDHKSPLIIGDLEVWPEDLGKLTWYEAKIEVAKLGPGWRLPTIEEFRETLFPNREKILKIDKTAYYWSSSEHDNYDNYFAWYFNFTNGNDIGNNKNTTYLARAVRDFNADTAIEYVFKDF